MATLLHSDSRRMYSWWWDSHNSPKNSKWLQENLTDMDFKVKSMIKLIEEDADSFARRAEMYYKKRPELMKLVEEFYRAYRALAERYDHATGALHQAHRTMAEAFPNQIPLVLSEESPSSSSVTEVEPHTPEMPPPIRALFDPDDLQKDAMGISSQFHAIKRNGAYSEENDALTSKKGLKQLNEMFASGEGPPHAKFSEARVKKGLNFQEEDGKGSTYKTHYGMRDRQKQESRVKEDASDETRCLQKEVSQLSTENQSLKTRITSESERANKAETEVQILKDALSKLEYEKEAALQQFQLSLKKISILETEISCTQKDIMKLNDEMLTGITNLTSAEEHCLQLEKANQSLQLELEQLVQKAEMQQQELNQTQEDLEKINNSIQDEHLRRMQAEVALLSLEKLHAQSQEEVRLMTSEIQSGVEMLGDMELRKVGFEDEIRKLKEENSSLNEQTLTSALKIKSLENEIICLKETKGGLEDEVGLRLEEKKALQQKVYCLEVERSDLEQRHRGLTEKMEAVSLNTESLQALVKELQDQIVKLKEICKKHEDEQVGSEEEIRKLKEENNSLNKQTLTSALKIKNLQDEIICLKETKGGLEDEVGLHLEDKKALQQKVYCLEEEKSDLDQRHQDLTEKMEAVSLKAESLQALVKESQEQIVKLKEICKKHQDEQVGLEEEIRNLKEENNSLNKQTLTSSLKIRNLQDEIICLKETKEGLEDEAGLYLEDKKALQQKVYCLEEERSDLDQRHQDLTEKMEAVRLKAESFQALVKELQEQIVKLKEILKKHEHEQVGLEEEIQNLKEENNSLNKQTLTSSLKIRNLQDEIICLNETKGGLEDEVGLHLQDKKALQQKVYCLEEERSDLDQRHQSLTEKMEAVSLKAESLQALVKELQEQIVKLKEICKKHEDEQVGLEEEVRKLKEENNSLNKQTLTSTLKIKNLEDEVICLKETKRGLEDEVGLHIEEKKVIQQKVYCLEEERSDLDQRHQCLTEKMKAVILSAESLQVLAKESQDQIAKLEEICKKHEDGKVRLEEEMWMLKEENNSLNEQTLTSALKVKNLQDEIVCSKETERRLEEEVGVHLEEKKVLQQKVYCLEEERSYLDQRHRVLTEKMEAISLNAESHRELIKKLQDQIVELKEICRKREDEKVFHLEKLKNIEEISEKNAVLEKSLSDANVELYGLREKIKSLEESCESLQEKFSVHVSEKAEQVSQIEIMAQNMEKLGEKNTFLENSLSDTNIEFEVLRGKLKSLEESCRILCEEKSNLLTENTSLVSQVGSITQSLENLASRYAELEDKHLYLQTEKELTLHQVVKLQDFLKLEKQERETLIESSKRQLATLQNHIYLLQEESRLREEEFEVEQHKIMTAQIEIFILQRFFCDMKARNLILSTECQKHLEASRCAEKVILELEQERFIQKKKVMSLSEHNEQLREGLHLLLKVLNTNKEHGCLGGVKAEVLLQIILGEIKTLLNSISDAHDEKQCLLLEIKVIVTLLQQFGLDVADLRSENNILEQECKTITEVSSMLQTEKHELLEMNEQLRQDVQAGNQREDLLKVEMEIVCGQLSDLQESYQTLQNEICKLLEENQSLSKKLYELREEKDELDEENSAILSEAMILDSLYLIFKGFNADRNLELKLVSDDLDGLRVSKSELKQEIGVMIEKMGVLEFENMHLKESLVKLEECRSRLMILEDDLNTARNVCEHLNHQIETGNNLLIQKDMELSEVNQKLQCTQDKNAELCQNLEGLKLDIDGAKLVREELEKKIFMLSEDNAHRDMELARVCELNKMLNWEQQKLRKEVVELRTREVHLTSELQKGLNEVECYEGEIATLANNIQILTVNAAFFEEKVFELLVASESLEISAMVQREMISEEITSRNAYMEELTNKLDDLEGENRGLKGDLNAYLALVMSLWGSIVSLEEHILSLTKHHPSNNQEKQDNFLWAHQHDKSSATVPARGVSELKRLHAKVEALQKVVMDTGSLIYQERLETNANLKAAMKEIYELKCKVISSKEEVLIRDGLIMQLERRGEKLGKDLKLQKGNTEISKVNYGQMMKDIQLDHVSSSSSNRNRSGSYGISRIETAETDDQMLELWEAAERDCNKQKQKASSVTAEDAIEYHQIEALEEEKSEYPSSELVAEKELSVDKLEVPKKEIMESHQEWNNLVIERLASDAQRLSVLQMSVQELKRTMEKSEKSSHPKSFEYDTIKAQLNEADGAILQLIGINSKLTKKAEDCSASSDSMVEEQEENRNTGEKQISERARRGSENIGRLELELQKIQYILLKLEEERENNRKRAAERRSSVLLRDYLHGKRGSRKHKKGSFCGCMRPKTKGD